MNAFYSFLWHGDWLWESEFDVLYKKMIVLVSAILNTIIFTAITLSPEVQ